MPHTCPVMLFLWKINETGVLTMQNISNIGMRMWYFKYDAEGLRFAKCSGGDDGGEDWDIFTDLLKRENKDRDVISKVPFMLEQDLSGKNPPVFVPGYMVNSSDDAWKFMSKWFSEVAMKCPNNASPCFLFSRSVIDAPHLNAFTATSCADYVFGTNCFRDGYSYLYRDSGTMTVSLQINENPVFSKIRRKWVKWSSQMQIVESSPRFLLVERSGKYGLYTLGIPSSVMTDIQRAGFIWNRNYQLWFGASENVSINPVLDIIRRDALPDPDVLGFVPEWHCHLGKVNKGGTKHGMIRGLLSVLFGRE